MQLKIPRLSPSAIMSSLAGPALLDGAMRGLAVVLAVLAVLLASRWLTELTAPRPVARLPAMAPAPPEDSLKTLTRLFGNSEAHTEALDGLQLVGVFAGSRGGGFATFRTRAGTISVFVGGEVAPGVTLKRIERDRVTLLSVGAPRELRLSEPGGQASAPIQQTAVPLPQPVSAGVPQGGETNPQASLKRTANTTREED